MFWQNHIGTEDSHTSKPPNTKKSAEDKKIRRRQHKNTPKTSYYPNFGIKTVPSFTPLILSVKNMGFQKKTPSQKYQPGKPFNLNLKLPQFLLLNKNNKQNLLFEKHT